MSNALENNVKNIKKHIEYILSLEKSLLTLLSESKIAFRRNGINPLPGLISLSFPGFSGEMILHRLDLKGIIVSTGSACNGSSDEISHVLQAINLPDEYDTGRSS